ncbi:MAG: ATP-binding cassette domain-containing protein [Patescibacteria group bacterium]|nr:ATP-binding cassette domain-containing protein [Patescibacteria group bacterium]MDE1941265.1 ATP-binding cassette domain-containing protein [Patescibacteria group bacterium]MDE1946252.1 ATP-binding cassette domain-containing protein [Patescibacteria group bacterium]
MKPIIEIKNIGKNYKIAHQRGGYIALRDVIMNILKKPFSFVKAKAKSAMGLASTEEFWALRDINLSVEKGEVIGIIGHNGAGKSTLLKILSQITPPTEGEIVIRGKVGSLLEVGTGFNPELTGRENIFLNGAIIGMTRREIASKFDQIVKFAEVEKFLDTPVKYYSSGMYVRLAFSVAAHMEPDILLVDEVLAVGDAEFQRKCLAKMEEVTHQDGRTIVFISHNLSAVERLCQKTVLLNKGRIEKIGETREVINHYLKVGHTEHKVDIPAGSFAGQGYRVTTAELLNGIAGSFRVPYDEPIKLRLMIEVERKLEEMNFAFACTSLNDSLIFIVRNSDNRDAVGRMISDPGTHIMDITLHHMLRPGTYYLGLGITKDKQVSFYDPNLIVLDIDPLGTKQPAVQENRGFMNATADWKLELKR